MDAVPSAAPAAAVPGQQANQTSNAGVPQPTTTPINAQTIAANAKPGETSSETVKRMLKAKVDGKEVEVSEEDALVAWQKSGEPLMVG